MKLLLFSDLHLGAGADLGRNPGDRLEDQVSVGKRIVEIAHEHECSLILNGGDTFEGPTVQPEEYDAYQRIFGPCELPIFSVRGNGKHDASKRLVSAPAVVAGSRYFTHPEVAFWRDIALAFLPSQSVSHLVAARNGGERADINREASALLIDIARGLKQDCEKLVPGAPHILLGHWPVEGAVTATGIEALTFAEPILPVDDLEAMEWAAVFCGHVHKPQELGCCNTIIPGSPLPLNFGEPGDHGCWIFDADTGEAEFVPIESRPLVELDWDHGFDPAVYHEILAGDFSTQDKVPGAILKVRYRATAADEKIDHRKLTEALYAAGAHNVWRIEAQVERETRARVEAVREDLDELAALDLWIEAQSIPAEMAERMRERTRAYLEGGAA